MITITVNGQELVIYKDTTLNIEYNNALFSQDAIEGDVTYSFDIPISGNERALNFEHLPYSVSRRMYDCTINVGGINMITGKLVVQKVTDKKYSVAVINNPFPDGMANQSIRKNKSEEIIISEDFTTHQNGWVSFLESTLSDDRIKFGPIVDEEGYGDSNEDFGFYDGRLQGKICNRVVFGTNLNIISSSRIPFVRLFNQSRTLDQEDGMYIERNQQCLLPQIRLGYILANIVANMGYAYIDRLSPNNDLNPIHIQSTTSLDASGSQYENFPSWYFLHAVRKGTAESGYYHIPNYNSGYTSDNPQGLMWIGNSEQNQFYGIKFQASGWYHIYGKTSPNVTPTGGVYFKIAQWGTGNTPPADPNSVVNVHVGEYNNNGEVFIFEDYIYIDASYVGIPLAIGFWVKTTFYGNEKEVFIMGGESNLYIESQTIDNVGFSNIYKNRFYLAECFPNVTNAEFLNSVIKSLGLAMYIDGRSGTIEIVPYKEIMNSQSIDLSGYVLSKESVIEYPEHGQLFVYRLSSQEEKEIDENKYIGAFDDISEAPSQFVNNGKICYIRNDNSYYVAEKVESEDKNWSLEWVNKHFNIQDLIIGGDGEKNLTKSKMVVPGNMKVNDYIIPIPYINFKIVSEMFNSSDEPSSDIIMLYYRGLSKYGTTNYKYQDMATVKTDGFSLNAESNNSICNKYIKEWRKLVSLSKTIKYKIRLPIEKVLEVVALLNPQHSDVNNQVRWLMVDNVRTMPKKISFQIDNNDALVLCEIEAAKLD